MKKNLTDADKFYVRTKTNLTMEELSQATRCEIEAIKLYLASLPMQYLKSKNCILMTEAQSSASDQ